MKSNDLLPFVAILMLVAMIGITGSLGDVYEVLGKIAVIFIKGIAWLVFEHWKIKPFQFLVMVGVGAMCCGILRIDHREFKKQQSEK